MLILVDHEHYQQFWVISHVHRVQWKLRKSVRSPSGKPPRCASGHQPPFPQGQHSKSKELHNRDGAGAKEH